MYAYLRRMVAQQHAQAGGAPCLIGSTQGTPTRSPGDSRHAWLA
jgi:hypothetical protein